MASIRKHRGKYQVRVRRSGCDPITKTFLRLSDAKEWARHIEIRVDRQELGPDRKILETITLADLVTRYLDEVVPKKRNGQTDTVSLNLILRHSISKKLLSDLNTGDFARYRDERLRMVSPVSLKRQFVPLHHMFGHAHEEWGIPIKNPLSDLTLKVSDNRRERRLLEGELERIFKARTDTQNSLVIPIVRFALETAMRRGEILALGYRDVDLDRFSLTIREAKNGYSRTIPLSSDAVSILKDRMDVTGKNEKLFPMSPTALRLAWDKHLKRAGIDDLHFHDLRHEAISRFFELGLTVPEVASISGHRDMRMLFRYAHANHQSIRAKLVARAALIPVELEC